MQNDMDRMTPDAPPRCSDAYLGMLCRHTGEAVVGTDADLRIQFWNRAAARMFGGAAEQMYGTALSSIIPQEARTEAERMLGMAWGEGEIGGFEFCARDGQGNRRHLAATVSPVVNETGTIIGASACIRDITQRILLQERLDQQRKMVSLGAMAGAMAHYFNNILGGAFTSVDFALASDDPELQKRTLEKTAQALARASELSDSLLTFAQGDFRTADAADLTETVLAAVQAVDPELHAANVRLDVRLEPVPVTAVPAVQFRTVLDNVIHNAIEAMPGGGKLMVELGPVEDGYCVRITDTGCGVSEEVRDRIFEPFYSTKGGGAPRAGLGLAVAHGILHTIGGRIALTSKVGEGSTFEITLPTQPKLPTLGLDSCQR
ncbi:MAG: ATP-binding protein [Planctomycetota bacterium]